MVYLPDGILEAMKYGIKVTTIDINGLSSVKRLKLSFCLVPIIQNSEFLYTEFKVDLQNSNLLEFEHE